MTMLCTCMCVCIRVTPTVQLFHRLTDIRESWYGRHAIEGHLNIVICNLLQPATLRPTRLQQRHI
jgi:hypothetical protein